ncbi:TVP38/TMEM64 family protein, partial [Rhizobiaceae sp. 2RAB30]
MSAAADAPAEPMAEANERSRLWRFVPLGVIAAVIVIAYAKGWYGQMSLASVAESRDALQAYVDRNYLLSLLGFMLLYVVVTAASIPVATMLTILGGCLFGWFVGGLVAAVGATIGAAVIFLA